MTTGRVVVLVGGKVVVVGAAVVGVTVEGVAAPSDDGSGGDVAGVDVVGVVDGGLTTVDVPADEPAVEAPGCSLATITPISAVEPVAMTAADLVMRRTRAWARSRV